MTNQSKRVVALGFFDGVHLGHQALLRRCVERAGELGLRSAVFTFDRSPKEAVTGKSVALLTTVEERTHLIRALFPIDDVIVASFDREMMTMDWRRFLELLVEEHGAAHLVVGHDFRCGYRGQGTPELLAQRCGELGLGCDIVSAVTLGGETVSSTRIRAALERGDRRAAEALLGHSLLRDME